MSKKNFKIRSVILCDDVRQEVSGKEILIGVYNDVLIFGKMPSALTRLVCRVSLDLIPPRQAKANLLIVDPSGEILIRGNDLDIESSADPPAIAGLIQGSVLFSQAGKYTI